MHWRGLGTPRARQNRWRCGRGGALTPADATPVAHTVPPPLHAQQTKCIFRFHLALRYTAALCRRSSLCPVEETCFFQLFRCISEFRGAKSVFIRDVWSVLLWELEGHALGWRREKDFLSLVRCSFEASIEGFVESLKRLNKRKHEWIWFVVWSWLIMRANRAHNFLR